MIVLVKDGDHTGDLSLNGRASVEINKLPRTQKVAGSEGAAVIVSHKPIGEALLYSGIIVVGVPMALLVNQSRDKLQCAHGLCGIGMQARARWIQARTDW
ncbi:hypothetical protein [Corynebacterium heidelbergense]|uniref:hypothetical protein n=1 Tax=Corynebacterium heidelbergense TaxID=2055947 RepID=UPI001EE69AFD|nr:hypothetical protein [Corynebacterium heidelbergense]WCZ35681.1 hypothetical protein CHEID_00510 [Corynebacterium heidelbergense]